MILFKQPHVVQQTSCPQCEIIWTKHTKIVDRVWFQRESYKKIKQMSLRANTNVSTSNSSRNASLESHFFLRIVLAPFLYMCDVSCLNSSPNLRNLRNLSNYLLKTPVLDRFLIETWGLIGSKRICISVN